MIRILKHIVKVILMFALIMCWGISIGYTNNIKPTRDVVNFFFEETEVVPSTLKGLKEIRDDVAMVGWREDALQTVTNKDLGRTGSDLKILFLKGDSSLIINSALLLEEDKEGCLIDEDTSYKLFGSKHAIGRQIEYGDRKLIVRGIHKETKANIIVQMLDNEENAFDGLALDSSKFTLTQMEDFRTQSGFKELPISENVYYNIARILTLILPIIILLIISFKLIIKAIKFRKKPVLCLIYLVALLLSGFIFFKVTKINISIPLDMLPNKWSDFEFWGKLWKEYMTKFEYLIYMKKYGIDIYNIQNLVKVVLYSIFTIVLFVINCRYIRPKDVKELIGAIGILIISGFITILFVNSKYSFDANLTMLWLIYPLYLCGLSLIKEMEKLEIKRQLIKEQTLEII